MTTQRGFTLIEMLVAISILAIIAVLGWRGLDGIVRARDAVGNEITFQRGLQAAFVQLEADLRQAARDPAAISALPGILFTRGEIVVLRQAPTASDGRLRYQLVRYEISNDQLIRRVRNVESPRELDVIAAAQEWPGAVVQVLAEGIRSAATRVWTNEGWRPPSGPVAKGLATAVALASPAVPPPAAVELVLTSAQGEQYRRAVLIRD
ncbi:MAG TPA: prepilin-type N-terminal cleavage/methylation domain-containing protein [Burkholderiaceae bacterium]|nr:prepilin-type N-terminal cleavage/methylation domain-containing protein [Burkholderiaceae bacterium]